MGVKGLWTILGPTGKTVKLPSLAGLRLAIDASIWIVQLLTSRRQSQRGRVKAYISGLYLRLGKLLSVGVRPVVVFDGETPRLKIETCKKRAMRRMRRDERFKQTLVELLAAKMMQDPNSFGQTNSETESPGLSISSSDQDSSDAEEEKVRFDAACQRYDSFSQFQVQKYCGAKVQISQKSDTIDKVRKIADRPKCASLSSDKIEALKRLGIIPGYEGEKTAQEGHSTELGETQQTIEVAIKKDEESSPSDDSSSSDSSGEEEEAPVDALPEETHANEKETILIEVPQQPPLSVEIFQPTEPTEKVNATPPSSPFPTDSPVNPLVLDIPKASDSPTALLQPAEPFVPLDLASHIATLESQLQLHPIPDDLSKGEIKEEIKELLSLMGIPW